MSKSKIKNTKKKPSANRYGRFDCSSVAQAETKTGLRREIIQALKALCTKAFHASGRIDSKQLLIDAAEHPEIVKAYESVPDIKLEKALTARVIRREGEVRLEQTLQTIAPIDTCRRILIRGGSMVRGKLMSIPDRVAPWAAMENDEKKIRERMMAEIVDALKEISEQSVEKLIKDILEDK